jgi:NAD(P)-dependent dehydrogenase (short-subunit alcohol dehydrogenase family)
MTGNEPGVSGDNDDHHDADSADLGNAQESQEVLQESPRGSMAEAQDAAAEEATDDRARRAEGGDPEAQAEQADLAKPDRVRHAAEWLDDKLVPRLGGAEVGPYDEEPEDSVKAHDVCPLCGHPMREHQIDRSHANAVLICPAPQIPERQSFEPLNEVGMIKRPRADKV